MAKTNICWSQYPVQNMEIPIWGMIHIGAHYGQELQDYVNYGIKNIMLFEPLSDNFGILSDNAERFMYEADIKLFNMALGNTTGKIEMFVEKANQGMSSSILEPGSHLESYPFITFNDKEIVEIDKLDNINFDRGKYNALNIDVQGYELEVLKGAEETLKTIDIIFTEVNVGEVYKGCGKLSELDEFLSGFRRMFTHVYENVGYGDAIYVKK